MKSRNMKIITFVIIITLTAITATLLLNASANADLLSGDQPVFADGVEVRTEWPEGQLEGDLKDLELMTNDGINWENISKILTSLSIYNEKAFNWMQQNYNSPTYGHIIQSSINMLNETRLIRDAYLLEGTIESTIYKIENPTVMTEPEESVDDGIQDIVDATTEFVDTIEKNREELDKYLEENKEEKQAPAASPRTFGARLKGMLKTSYAKNETDTRYAVETADNTAGIKEAKKTISENEKFRHIDVEIKITPDMLSEVGEGEVADIVLLLDTSDSMFARYPDSSETKWDTVKRVAEQFVEEIFILSPESRVGVASFGTTQSKTMVRSFLKGKDEKDDIIKSFTDITPVTVAATNSQEGLFRAREILELTDDVENIVEKDGRKKIVINLTDGVANIAFSDTSEKEDYIMQWLSPSDAYPYHREGYRRWSKIGQETRPSSRIYTFIDVKNSLWMQGNIDQRSKDYWSTNRHDDGGAMSELAYILDGQFMVSQGVDFYAIQFSTIGNYNNDDTEEQKEEIRRRAKEILELSTYKMVDPPESFRSDIDRWNPSTALPEMQRNPIKNTSFTDVGYEDRVYQADNADELLEALKDILSTIQQGNVPEYTITDYYNTDVYELVEGSVEILGPEASKDTVDFSQPGTIVWSSKGQTYGSGFERTLKYQIRVIDDKKHYPYGAGQYNANAPAGSEQDKVTTGAKTKFEFLSQGVLQFYELKEQPVISIERLIDGQAIAFDSTGLNELASVFSEKVKLGGKVTRGNGSYSYQWYEGNTDASHLELTSGKQLIAKTTAVGNELVDQYIDLFDLVKEYSDGEYEFTLKLWDNIASKNDLYKTEGVAYVLRQVKVRVLTGEVTIIVEAKDTKTKGLFETRVTKGLESKNIKEHDRWYFLGPGTRTYKVSLFVDADDNINVMPTDFIVMTAQSYVPYGYELKVKDDPEVEIIDNTIGKIAFTPKKVGTTWTLPSKTITIEVRKEEKIFFYDWTWGPEKKDTIIFNKESTVK